MQRILEPELMDDVANARAYAQADFTVPHDAIVRRVLDCFPALSDTPCQVLDLGCGPCDVSVRLARALPAAQILALDGAANMLRHAEDRILREELADRIQTLHELVPCKLQQRFDVVFSSSLLHHLHTPHALWQSISDNASDNAVIYVADLARPATREVAEQIVQENAGDEPQVLKDDFFYSLCAAFTVEEVQQQLAEAGLDLEVAQTSPHHLAVWGRLH